MKIAKPTNDINKKQAEVQEEVKSARQQTLDIMDELAERNRERKGKFGTYYGEKPELIVTVIAAGYSSRLEKDLENLMPEKGISNSFLKLGNTGDTLFRDFFN